MRDYVREMLDAWTGQSAQAAYDLGARLRQEIEEECQKLQRHDAAIQAFGVVLRDDPEVDTSVDPADPDPALDTIEAAERPRMIVEAAIEVWTDRKRFGWTESDAHLINAADVIAVLRTKGLDLGVQQPLAVIGTVLSAADGFRKVARNTFERLDPKDVPSGDVEGLPW